MARLGVGATDVAKMTARKRELYRAMVAEGAVALFPGVVDMLGALTEARRRLYIATSASRQSAQAVLVGSRICDYFEGVVCSDDVREGKPSPEIYQHTQERFGLSREDTVVVEDADSGVQAAQAAGLRVVLVHREPGSDDVPTFASIAALSGALLGGG